MPKVRDTVRVSPKTITKVSERLTKPPRRQAEVTVVEVDEAVWSVVEQLRWPGSKIVIVSTQEVIIKSRKAKW